MTTLSTIPSAVSPREARFMRDTVRGRSVVEYGSLLGFSTVVLAQAAAWVTSIDRHEGYSGATLAPFLSNLDRCGVRDTVTVVQGDALAHADLTCDVAFIDLTGGYDLTRTLLTRLGSPLALVHDFARPHCDIERAVHDAGWTPIGCVDSLVLCERRAVIVRTAAPGRASTT